MSELILHHYDLSPYAEKIRLIMGYKGLAWKSVQIPMVMPKPDLTCLTGGYRKPPVLQIGADIYCDTKTIARALECVRPQPTLYPQNCEASERALSSMADAMFLMAVFAAGVHRRSTEDGAGRFRHAATQARVPCEARSAARLACRPRCTALRRPSLLARRENLPRRLLDLQSRFLPADGADHGLAPRAVQAPRGLARAHDVDRARRAYRDRRRRCDRDRKRIGADHRDARRSERAQWLQGGRPHYGDA